MNMGVKHSLCLISMLSKMHPSESRPTKKGFEGRKSFRIWEGSLIRFTIFDLRFTRLRSGCPSCFYGGHDDRKDFLGFFHQVRQSCSFHLTCLYQEFHPVR